MSSSPEATSSVSTQVRVSNTNPFPILSMCVYEYDLIYLPLEEFDVVEFVDRLVFQEF